MRLASFAIGAVFAGIGLAGAGQPPGLWNQLSARVVERNSCPNPAPPVPTRPPLFRTIDPLRQMAARALERACVPSPRESESSAWMEQLPPGATRRLPAWPQSEVSGIPLTASYGPNHVTGTVISDEGGAPIPGVSVWAYPIHDNAGFGAGARTGADGTFEITGLFEGYFAIIAWDTNGKYFQEWWEDADLLNDARLVDVGEGIPLPDIVLGLRPASRIVGTIRDEVTGEGIAGLWVTGSEDPYYARPAVQTDTNGLFVLSPLEAGTYTLSIYDYASFYPIVSQREGVVVEAGSDTNGIDLVLASNGGLRGSLVSASSSEPVADATLVAWDPSPQSNGASGLGFSDGLGRFRVGLPSSGSYLLFAEPSFGNVIEAYFPGVVDEANAMTIDVEQSAISNLGAFPLPPGGILTGTVFDSATSAPIPGADVFLSPLDTFHWLPGAVADREGKYRLEGLASGRYAVGAIDTLRGYVPRWRPSVVNVLDSEPVDVLAGSESSGADVSLPIGGRIEGKITTKESSDPIASAYVSAFEAGYGTGGATASLRDGSYRVVGLETGDYLVGAWAPGRLPVLYDGALSAEEGTPVPVVLGQSVRGIDLQLPKGGKILGRAIDTRDGSAVPSALVVAVDSYRQEVAWASCEADGSFELTGLFPGGYRVLAYPPAPLTQSWYGGESFESATVIDVALSATVEGIVIELGLGGAIEGRVVDRFTGDPIADVFIEVASVDWAFGFYAFADSDGRFLVDTLPAGSYYVFVEPFSGRYPFTYWPDSPSAEGATLIRVELGKTTTGIDFSLVPRPSISGRVVDRVTGAPLEYASVSAYDLVGTLVAGDFTRDTGEYELFVDPGLYALEAEFVAPTYEPLWWPDASSLAGATPLDVANGENHTGIDFALRPAPGSATFSSPGQKTRRRNVGCAPGSGNPSMSSRGECPWNNLVRPFIETRSPVSRMAERRSAHRLTKRHLQAVIERESDRPRGNTFHKVK